MLKRMDAPNTTELDRLAPRIPSFVRTQSAVRASVMAVDGRSMPDRVFETGGLRIRFPRVGGPVEGVLLNSAGGIAGGDHQDVAISVGPEAQATITTQSAEKIYKADGVPSRITNRLDVAANATLHWLPQETILFDQAQLNRTLDANLHASSTLTICESVVFGRTARGERVTTGGLHDRWRVRRDGGLLLAEDVRLDGPIGDMLARPALADNAVATATLAYIAPDAERHLDAVRAVLANAAHEAGCSAWNGMLVVRLASANAQSLRATLAGVLTLVTNKVLPRVWSF
jgi:urease accessory protein